MTSQAVATLVSVLTFASSTASSQQLTQKEIAKAFVKKPTTITRLSVIEMQQTRACCLKQR